MDSRRERKKINERGKQRRRKGRWTLGKEDECAQKELGKRPMEERGVKEG